MTGANPQIGTANRPNAAFRALMLRGAWATREAVYRQIRSGETSSMSIDTTGGHEAMDYPQHIATYKLFLRLSIWLVILCVILLAGMAYFLV